MKLDTSQAQKIVLRVTGNSWFLLRGTGASGSEHHSSGVAGGTWETFGLDVAGQPLVGFSVVTTNSCHWAKSSTLRIDWVRLQ